MIMKILWLFIILFLVMVVLAFFRRTGSTKATKREVNKQIVEVTGYEDKIRDYEEKPDHGDVTEDDYLYSCYMAGKRYNGIDLKKAVAFQTTCDARNLKSEGAMKNLFRYGEIYGGIGSDDVAEIYRLGKIISDISQQERAD